MKKKLRNLLLFYLGIVSIFVFWGIGNQENSMVLIAQLEIDPGDMPDPPQTWEALYELIVKFRNILLGLVGLLSIFMFIWAGVSFMTAEGDSDKIKEARARLMYGLIGVMIALGASGIFAIILNLIK